MAQFLNSLDELTLPGVWATIGSFDGVHLGHQALLSQMVQQAHREGAPAAALTFFPHPGKVLGGRNGAFYLSHPDERARKLAALGLDAIITLTFTRDLASQTAYQFMSQLKTKLGLAHLWIGEGFALGKNREGTAERLAEIGRVLDYRLTVVQPLIRAGVVISSSLIRSYLSEGKIDAANQALGYAYTLNGVVVEGDRRGRLLGFPTANLAVWAEQILPARGVYAGWAVADGRRVKAITNIGVRPTFTEGEVVPRIESHLLDFDGDLYGKELTLEFTTRLRDEQRFASVNDLIAQLTLDKQRAKDLPDE